MAILHLHPFHILVINHHFIAEQTAATLLAPFLPGVRGVKTRLSCLKGRETTMIDTLLFFHFHLLVLFTTVYSNNRYTHTYTVL